MGNRKWRFVLEPSKDGRLQVRSSYTAGDVVAQYVESRLRLLLRVIETDAKKPSKTR